MKMSNLKKTLLTAAVMSAIAGMPATGMAAASGFDDVPLDNWSYGAIQTLLKDGVIDSFDDNTFNGQKIVTRFEMAQIIRRADNKAVKSTTISEADKALVVKLAHEYKAELQQLKHGTLTSANENTSVVRPGKGGIIDFGDTKAYVRSDTKWSHPANKKKRELGHGAKKDLNFMDVELRGRYEFAPKWNARFMLEMMRNFSGNSLMKDGEGSIKEFSFDGPMKLGSTQGKFYLGRYKYKPVLGYVTKAYFQGARYNFKTGHKNRLNTEIAWGKFSSKYEPETDKIVNGDSSVSWLYSPASINTAILNLSYPLDRKTKLYGGAYWLYTDRKDYHGTQIFELAGQHQHNKEFKSYFDVARSNADSDRMLYYYGLKYHNDSIQQPKSWSWMLQYAWHEAKSTINSDLDIKN